MTLTTKRDEAKKWAACREAVALGVPIKEAAERYSLGYAAARKRATREKWATPRRMSQTIQNAPLPPPSQVAAVSWAEQGEQHRRRIMGIVNRALEGANLPSPENWADLERAARIGDRAAGLEKQAPTIQLAFPIANSSEVSPFYEASPDSAATSPHLTPSPSEP
jgi:hypothetical protein